MSRLFSMLALCTLVLGLVGCMKDKMSDDKMMASSNPKDNVVVVTGGHGMATYSYNPTTNGPTMVMSGGATECPQCTADVKSYYMTGKIDEKCATCGAMRMVHGKGYKG